LSPFSSRLRAAATAWAVASVLHDHGVTDLAGATAPVPRLAVEDQAAADAGAPEDSEQRAVGLTGAEHELRVGRDADVVAERDLRAERRLQGGGEREARVPAGQVVGPRDGAGLAVHAARRADAHPAQLRRFELGRLGGLGQRGGHRVGDVNGAAGGRRRMAGTAEHAVGRVGDDRLDLGAAEIDAAHRVAPRFALACRVHSFQVTSSTIVTGPSAVSSISILAPKRPREAPIRSQNRS
jgi:hypothetical protein